MGARRRILGLLTPLAVTACLFLQGVVAAASAAPFTPEERARVDKLVSSLVDKPGTPSISVAVVRDGKLAFAQAYGWRSLSPAAPASVATRYRIGSISKQFTATAILNLVQAGKLSLDDPVGRYVAGLGESGRVTIRQALSHTGGFREFAAVNYWPPETLRPITPQAIIERWATGPLEFEPGTRWSYSNTGYVVLGRVVEVIEGQPLSTVLQRLAFDPLGMTTARDVDLGRSATEDATGYWRVALGPLRPSPTPAAGWTFAAGQLAMSATDLATWDLSVINRGLLPQEFYVEQQSEAKLKDGSGTSYGFGLFVDELSGHRVISHNGIMPGFTAENRIYPDDRAAVVVLVNTDFGPALTTVADALEEMIVRPVAEARRARSTSPTPLARRLVDQLRMGLLDRSLLTDDASAYLTGDTLSDYQTSFQKLGDPVAFIRQQSETANGLTTTRWQLAWPSAKMMLLISTRADGKVAEFLALPLE